jgi:hypothetical protein
MKLTTEQIECINQALIKKEIKFDDLKIEVLDHIASQIEFEMEVAKQTFSDAFNQVFERWKEEFMPIRAYFSLNTYYPKLARTKFGNQLKWELVTAITLSLILILSFQLLSDSNARFQFIFWIKKVFFYIYFGTFALVLFLKFLNSKSKISSTYKYTFELRFPVFLVWIAIVFNDNIPNDKTNQNMLVLAMGYVFVFLISTVYLGFKHYQFQNKFSIQ